MPKLVMSLFAIFSLPVIAQTIFQPGHRPFEIIRPPGGDGIPIPAAAPAVDKNCLLMNPPPSHCIGQWQALQRFRFGPTGTASPFASQGCATKADVAEALAQVNNKTSITADPLKPGSPRPTNPAILMAKDNSDPMETKNNPFATKQIEKIRDLYDKQKKLLDDLDKDLRNEPKPKKK